MNISIKDINILLESAKFNSRYDNLPLSKEEQAIEYLLRLVEQYEEALREFVDKHFHGGSKSNRDDYVGLGIPTADIFKLKEALRKGESDWK